MAVTPVSLAVAIATVANGGRRLAQFLLKAIDTGDGWIPAPPPPPKSVVSLKARDARDTPARVVAGGHTAPARADARGSPAAMSWARPGRRK